jgi:hypothetical protein
MGNIVWSTSELESIKKQTLGNLRPLYYSSSNRKYLQISDDFEGYLILQSAEEKRKILTWISDITKINNDTEDQNVLLQRFMDVRSADADDRISELDEKLDNFSELQADLITDGNDVARYSSIIELDAMVRSISKPLDNLLIQREQAFHEKNVIAAVTNTARQEKITDDTKKELSSWQTVISAYKGETQKQKSKTGVASMGGVF